MTGIVDKFFIYIGFDKNELEMSDVRGLLYIGIVFMMGVSSAFIIMTLIG